MTSTPHNWSFQNYYNNYFPHTAIAAIAGPVDICIAEAADSHQIRCETVMEDAVQRIQSTTLSACDASSLARTPQTSLYGRGIQQEAVYGHSYPAHDSNPYGKLRHVDDSRRQVCADDASCGKTAVTMNEISARAQTREDADVAPPRVGNLLDNFETVVLSHRLHRHVDCHCKMLVRTQTTCK